jgi:hypothetical protein
MGTAEQQVVRQTDTHADQSMTERGGGPIDLSVSLYLATAVAGDLSQSTVDPPFNNCTWMPKTNPIPTCVCRNSGPEYSHRSAFFWLECPEKCDGMDERPCMH